MGAALQRVERKLDSLVQVLCCLTWSGSCGADVQIADFGVPAEKNRKECEAARTTQKAWRRKQIRLDLSYVQGDNCNAGVEVAETCGKLPIVVARAPLIGVWEPIDPWLLLDKIELGKLRATCQHNYDLVSIFTPFSCFATEFGHAGKEQDSEPPNEVAPATDSVAEYTSAHMRAMIDAVVANVKQHPHFHERSTESVAEIAIELKTLYPLNEEVLFTIMQAKELMELTGKLCGDAVCRDMPEKVNDKASESSSSE